MSIEWLGHIGAFLLVVCAIPQFLKTMISKDVSGVSPTMLVCWAGGCASMGLYVLLTTAQMPLLINYAFNTVVVTLTAIFYFVYRKK
jgi:uncharacterized protein with PQ loop repeat